jgi:hypothetical protein
MERQTSRNETNSVRLRKLTSDVGPPVTVISEENRKQIQEILGRRCKQLVDDLKEKRRYWKLKEEALEEATDLS